MTVQVKSQKERTALLAGATGLVGGHLLELALASAVYRLVIVFVRRPLEFEHPRLKAVVVDFDHLEQYTDFMQVDDVFCCLGTTIEVAKSKAAFRKVDYNYPLELARNSHRAGATTFSIVTALGANRDSRIFYNWVKGEIEEKLKSISFESLVIYRPSLLLGNRREFRLGELIGKTAMQLVNPFLIGNWRKYRAIHSKTVAQSMLSFILENPKGIHILESDKIEKVYLSNRYREEK